MGSTKSKFTVLSYEDAEKRLSDKELSRLKRAFSQIAPRGILSLDKFRLEVFGEFVPYSICETLFDALKIGTYSSGISFKELLIGIIILTGGSYEEKCKLIFSLYCNDSGTGIEHSTLQSAVDHISDINDLRMVRSYLDENSTLSFEKFMKWIGECPKFNEMTYWLLLLDTPKPLTDNSSPLDLYQSVAGVTHLDETEIIALEKTYNKLVASIPQRTLNFEGFSRLISPQLQGKLIKKLFLLLDENEDGSIDLKELACGISACTRGPLIERKKFCCKLFDDNLDGKLSSEDIETLFEMCNEIKCREVVSLSNVSKTDKSDLATYLDLLNSILSSNEMVSKMSISIDDFLIWMNDYDFIDPLLDLLNQIFTIIFNVRPQSCTSDEEEIISRWLKREENHLFEEYDGLYLISRAWLKQWLSHIRNSKKESIMNPMSTESRHEQRVSYSKSMNNVLHFPKKHQYDLTKSNRLPTRVKSSEEIVGRYTLHTSINGGQNATDIIYPDFAARGDFCNYTGSNTSISSFSSSSSFQDILPSNKLIPINNQDLLNSKMFPSNPEIIVYTEGGNLDSCLKLGEDFELLPPPIWTCLLSWYGGGPTIFRPAWLESRSEESKNPKVDDNCIILNRNREILKVEIHLLTLFIMRHVTPTSSTRNVVSSINKFDLPSITMTTEAGFSSSSINSQKSTLGGVTISKRLIRGRLSFSRRSPLSKLIEFLSVRLKISKDEMRIWKVIDDNNLILLDDEESCLYELDLNNSDKILVEQRNMDLTWPEELNQLAKIRSLQSKKASSFKGITGLSNIGNTCFFNSALQCISNTNVLTDYFIRDIHLCELNRTNAQGCNGMVALRYAELMKDIWAGSSNLIVPLKLKMTIDQYVHQFSENQQHDAQEFLSALLDSLHEDLNRVKEKPRYKELKDSDGRCDEEVANEAWQSHIESNQSIIVDLFHGLLRSNVCCDICKNDSVRFDAYSMLSLPIPMQTNREIDLLVFYRDSAVPRKHCVVVNSFETTPSFIRDQLAKQLALSSRNLLLALVEEEKIKKLINHQDKILMGQTIYAYIVGDNDDNLIESPDKFDNMEFKEDVIFVIYHRRMIQKSDYFMAHSRTVPEIFSYPVIFTVKHKMMNCLTNKNVYEKVLSLVDSQNQIKFFMSDSFNFNRSLHQTSNHAVDCDSMDHAQPFKLSRITYNGKQCNQCHWSRFCRGCILNCSDDIYKPMDNIVNFQYVAIDWSPTALHLRFNTENEKTFIYHDDYKDIKSSNNQPMDLLKCIEIFTTEETLGKDTLYQCTKCKEPQPAHKKLDLWTLPPVLIIHLKRFQFLDNKWQKSHKVVRYPIRNLDLNNFIKNSSSRSEQDDNEEEDSTSCPIYNLYAVNCHLGSLQMGHYITYARNKETGNWYMYNDSICKEVNEKEVNTNSAYLLFYERANFDFEKVLDELADTKVPVVGAAELISDQEDTDIKKYCIIQ